MKVGSTTSPEPKPIMRHLRRLYLRVLQRHLQYFYESVAK